MAAKKTSRAKSGAASKRSKTSRGKLAPGRTSRGLAAAEVPIAADNPEVADLASLIIQAGGAPIGAYREPLGGRAIMIASLPLAAVQPTPFQRDLSPTHVKRLAAKIDETGAFLDPLIVVRGEDGRLWTPNGRHRLAAAKVLGLKQITALVSLVTLGAVYEQSPRFAGGAYSPFLKKVDRFSDRPLATSLRERDAFASRLLEIDAQVKRVIADLTARGFKSPYLRNYVVARINPVRFHKTKKGDTKPPMPIAQALTRMAASAKKFDVKSVSNAEIAWVAVGAGAAAE
jgi:ParB family transcriptional regulator, chromosome partitioning protein